MKPKKTTFDPCIVGCALSLLVFTACDTKTNQEKIGEAKAEATEQIHAAQAKADEAASKAAAEIEAAKRKAAAKIQATGTPPVVVPTPSVPPETTNKIDRALNKAEDKVKDLLDVRPNEAVKDRLENAAEDARSAADDAAAQAEEAARKAAEATRKAGQ